MCSASNAAVIMKRAAIHIRTILHAGDWILCNRFLKQCIQYFIYNLYRILCKVHEMLLCTRKMDYMMLMASVVNHHDAMRSCLVTGHTLANSLECRLWRRLHLGERMSCTGPLSAHALRTYGCVRCRRRQGAEEPFRLSRMWRFHWTYSGRWSGARSEFSFPSYRRRNWWNTESSQYREKIVEFNQNTYPFLISTFHFAITIWSYLWKDMNIVIQLFSDWL